MMDGVSDEQLRSLLAVWRIGVTQLDKDCRIVRVNNELLRIDGRQADAIVGKTVWEAWPELADNSAGLVIRQAVEDGMSGADKLYRFERSDRQIVWLDYRVHPWGEGAVIFCLDMTDRLALEKELTDLERRYMLASRATADIMYEWDLANDALRFSEIGAGMLGAASLTSPAMEWWRDRLHPDDRNKVFEQIETALKSGASQWDLEYRLCLPSGNYVLMHQRGFVLYDDAGKPMRTIGAMSDITEMRETQRQVKQLQNELIHMSRLSAMDTMASVMAHELNQPLAAIGTYLAGTERLLMAEGGPDVDLVLKGIRQAREGSARAGEIIRRTRRMTQTADPAREPMNVLKAVEDASALVLAGRREQGRDLRIDIAQDLTVQADIIQIEQVLMNLIRNALEANDETDSGDVVVRARRRGREQMEIMVEDRGPGISDAAMETLFDFFSTTKKNGMGIGLPISRTIVETHNGFIHVENRANGGARFRVILPLTGDD